MSTRVLLIDDDERLFELLETYLAQNDVALFHARDGASGLRRVQSEPFEVILLDVMMPGMDGLEVLRKLRAKTKVPVVMLTARGDEADRVVGLELGADDYVPKPFGPRELLARIRAVLRRTQPNTGGEELSVAGVVADSSTRQVSVDGVPIELTGLEFDILLALMKRAGRVIPRTALLEEAGRDDVTVGERAIDVHISKLRKKLNDDPDSPKRIRTVRGVGYVFAKEKP